MPKGKPGAYKVRGVKSSGLKKNFGRKVSAGAKTKGRQGRRFGKLVSGQAKKKRATPKS